MSDGGKFDEEDVSRHQKKKTIYTTARAFPYLTNRIEIVKSHNVSCIIAPLSVFEQIIMTPIECAIEGETTVAQC